MFSPQRLEIYREKMLFEPPSLTRALLHNDESVFGVSEHTSGKCFISKRMGVDYENLDGRFLPFITLASSLTTDNIYDTIYFRVEPQEGIWRNFVFNFQIKFSNSFPIEPPKVKCLSPIFHPNVHPNSGEVCLPILLQNEWKSCFVISTILMTIESMLCPESDGTYPLLALPTSFINYEASKLARTNHEAFVERTRNFSLVCYQPSFSSSSSATSTYCSNNITMDDNYIDVMDDDFDSQY